MFVFGLPIVGYYGCSKFAFPRMINGRSCKVLGAMVVVGVLASGLVWFGIDALHDMLMVLSNGEVGLLV